MKKIIKSFETVAFINIIAVFAISGTILLGWFLFDSPIKNLFPGNQLSNPVTAVSFLLASLSLVCLINSKKQCNTVGKVLALIVTLIGLIKFSEVLFNYSTGIDKWLFTNKLPLNSNTGKPNYMAPNTAICFFIIGISLLLYRYKISKKNLLSDYFASAVGLISLASLMGYVYQSAEFYHAKKYIPMAFPTALSFFLISSAVLLNRNEFGFFSLFTTKYEGSKTARFLVPFAIIIPITTGFLQLFGTRTGLYSAGLGQSLFDAINIVLFLFVIWRSALSINTSGKALEAEMEMRKKNEEIISRNQQSLKHLYDNAPSGYYSLDANGAFINANNTALEWLGYKKEELMTKSITDILTAEGKEIFKSKYPVFKQTGFIKELELYYLRKDGTAFPVIINSTVVKNQKGEFLYTSSTILDITERKKLEEEINRSHIFLDSILENIPHMVFVKDAEQLKFVQFNKAGEELLGISKEEIIGKTDYDFFPGERADYFTATDKKVLNNKNLVDITEEEIETKKGNRWLHTKKIPILDNNGSPLYLLGVSEDITDRKKLEDALKNTNDIFLKLFYASPLAMIIRNLEDGKIIDVNEEYERLLGYKKEELVGQTSVGMGMIVDPGFSNEVRNSATKNRSLKNIDATLINAKNEPINVIVSIETVRLGNKDCIISALLDITQRKQLEKNLNDTNKELESFSYSVSHDLRAPLRIINGYAEIIKEDTGSKLPAESLRMLENIILNAKHMGTLIDDLLNFSRLGRRELMTHSTDMMAIVGAIAEQQAGDKNIIKIKINSLPECNCDSRLIKQAWENLISNAIKYSSKNEKPVIEIGSFTQNNEVVYYIKDNGVGFDMKYYDKLFGVFQRLHKAVEFEGTGVGLALTRRIIEKHKGKIWAESKVNEGSTFYFTIGKA